MASPDRAGRGRRLRPAALAARPVSALAIAIALHGTGCSLAPDYHRPRAPVPARWPGGAPAAAGARARLGADLGWRDVFGEPRLARLIALALRDNRDLRVAVLAVAQARAQRGVARAARWPSIGALGQAELVGARDGLVSEQYRVGLGVTAFEVDLFGRVASGAREAVELYLATAEARRAAQLALVAAVAEQDLELRSLDEQVSLATSTLTSVRESYELTQQLLAAGQRSELDARTAEAQVEGTRAELARVQRLRAQAGNALALLIGGPLPGDLPPPRPLDAPGVVAEIPAGLRSDVLLRRPDVAAAEHRLIAAHARIGVARAAYFPSISLTGFGGLASTALSSLFRGASALWAFSPTVALPLFTAGRTAAEVEAAQVARRIEVARYEGAIQVAFREVADALDARGALDAQLEAQAAAVAAERRRFEVSELRYRTGVESYVAVLTAQRDLFAAQQRLIDVRLARLVNLVALYRAVGGGWRERTAGPASGD